MHNRTMLAAAIGILFGLASATDSAGASGLVVFPTQARVEVDNNGNVVAVTPDPKLSPAIGKAIQNDVGQWHFAAPTKDGRPVGGVTFVQVDACAEPKDGKYLFVVKYRGNGPGLVGAVVPPAYPQLAMKHAVDAKLRITFRILPDGGAQAEDVEFLDGGNVFESAFRKTAKSWIEHSRFQPEQVDGQAVSTRESYVITFGLGAGPRHSPEVAERLTECRAALTARDADARRVALDSPFSLIPAN